MTKTTKEPKVSKKDATYTKSPDGTLEFKLTIPQAVVEHAYQESLRESASRVNLPGFRKGKAPIALAEKQLDKSAIYTHALEHAFPPVYAEFIKDNDLRPLTDPEVVPVSMPIGKDWEMKVKVATFPEVKLGKYQTKIKAIKTFKDEKNKLPEIFDALLDSTSFEVSPVLVMAETKAAITRLAKQLSSLKLSVEDYAKSINKSVDDLIKDYETTATTNLRLEFLLYEITLEQGFKPEERQKTLDFLTNL